MAVTNINLSDTMTAFVEKTNIISGDLGDVTNLVTGDSNVVDAINAVREIVSAFDDSGELTTISREAISLTNEATGIALAYDTASGVFTLTGSADSSSIRNLFSVGDGLIYDSATGQFSIGNYVSSASTSGNGISGSVNSIAGTFTVTSNATDSNEASTIVFRDANGDFAANLITATATQAQYADVAEMYTTDQVHPAGTVMTINIGQDHEMEAWSADQIVTGVVSTDPAYIMNFGSTGQPIALVGRVPVRVRGAVSKGDIVYASANGIASTEDNGPMVGIALEANAVPEVKLVECYLKF